MMKNGSSSTPARPMITNLPHPFDPSDEMMKSPACHVSMEVSNIVTPQSMVKDKRVTKWSLDDFHIGRRLGEGSYSTVILVEEKKTGFLCALKVIKKSLIRQYNQEHQLIRELEIHMRLFHKHILRMYDFFYDTNRIYVILEYAPNDTLASYLKQHHRLDNNRTATFVYQIADALHYCHRLQIMHRDLKPENILLGQFHEIKLADFGLALHCPSSRRTQYIGTMDYMAPEVIENEDVNNNDLSSSSIDSTRTTTKAPMPYEELADLWSLGVITYELLVGTTPFYDPDMTTTKKRILTCDYSLPDQIHSDAQDLIRHLIKYHRNERYKLADVFEHKYLQTFAHKNFMNETLNQLASLHHYRSNGK